MARYAWLAAAALALAVASCDCSRAPAGGEDGGGEADGGGGSGGGVGGGGGGGGGGAGGGGGSSCLPLDATCSANEGCCSAFCVGGQCQKPWFCGAPGEACASHRDCCTSLCAGGRCSSSRCKDVGDSCGSGGECCTLTCTAGQCGAIPGQGGCKVLGQACAAGGECCSTNCRGGFCVPAYACQANGDVCASDHECCGGACSTADGGYCLTLTGGGGGGCLQDGNPCPTGGSNCCSRTCIDLGAGAPVCLPAGGCRLTGNFCLDTASCCGGAPNPNGSVLCDPVTRRCDNGRACNGVGNICGAILPLPDGGSVSINASQDCCNGKKSVCKLDSSGIPRCFGGCPNDKCAPECPTGYTGSEPCCIGEGQGCQFSDQCCGKNPCLPNPDGGAGFVCASVRCQPQGGACTATSDCCAGHHCNLPSGATTGTCESGTCPGSGQSCSSSSPCCTGLHCAEPDGLPCGGGASCRCAVIIQ